MCMSFVSPMCSLCSTVVSLSSVSPCFRFSSLARDVLAWNTRDSCTSAAANADARLQEERSASASPFHLSVHWWLATACICSAMVLYRVLYGGGHHKPKLN